MKAKFVKDSLFEFERGKEYENIKDIPEIRAIDPSGIDEGFKTKRVYEFINFQRAGSDASAAEILKNAGVGRSAVTITWGKHRGKTVGDVFNEDPQYIVWLAKEGNPRPGQETVFDEIRRLAEKHLADIEKKREEEGYGFHYGRPGDIFEGPIEVRSARYYSGDYGNAYQIIGKYPPGQGQAKHWVRFYANLNILEKLFNLTGEEDSEYKLRDKMVNLPGKIIDIKGKVTKHTEYKGQKTTNLNYVKFPKPITESLDFERGKDPKQIMGIGKIEEIRNWLEIFNLDGRAEIIPTDRGYEVVVNGGITFSHFGPNPDVPDLPTTFPMDTLKILGSFYMDRSAFTNLPRALQVTGNLDLSYYQGEELPEELEVGKILDIENTKHNLVIPNTAIVGEYVRTSRYGGKVEMPKHIIRKRLQESVNFQRGEDPHKALRIGKYSKSIPEIVSADIEIMPEPGNQDSYYYESLDHYEVLDVLNNWEIYVKDDNYSFWVIEEEGPYDPVIDQPDYWLWKDLEGITVKYADELYDIPKTNYKVKS